MNKNLGIGLISGILVMVVGLIVYNNVRTNNPDVRVNPAPQDVASPQPGGTDGLSLFPFPVANPSPAPSSNDEDEKEPAAPIAVTGTTAAPSISSVVLTGNVNPNGASTSYWYEYGETLSLGERTSAQNIGAGFSSIYAPQYITGLKPNTTYFYRLSAANRFGVVHGTTQSFKTNNNPAPQGLSPTIRTLAATNVSRISANLRGRINPNNSATTYWFEFGDSADLGSVSPFQSAGSGGSVSDVVFTITNLRPLTRYFYRLNAQNRYGTVNGDTLSFTTLGPATIGRPIIQTTSATQIDNSSARLNGQVNPNGSATFYWFEFGEEPTLNSLTGRSSEAQALANQPVTAVWADVSALKDSTVYFYRLVGRNQFGTTSGEIRSFTTK